MAAHEPALIRLENLRYSYAGPAGPVVVLNDVSLTVRRGEFISILGSSGGGKSTLLNLIGGLDRPLAGRLAVDDKDLTAMGTTELEHYRQSHVAFIFQFFNLLPTLTALENVLLAMEAMQRPPPDAEDRARHFLTSVGLATKMARFPSQLSGGEQQRVAVARALAKGAPLILADEPTGNLDEETAATVMDLIVDVQRKAGATLVLITHDNALARRAGRVVQLVKGDLRPVRFEEAKHAACRA